MKKEIKAHYNLLKMRVKEDHSIPHLPWMVEDLSQLSVDQLFDRLKLLNINLTPDNFPLYLEEVSSPEELFECVMPEGAKEELLDQAYLLIFQLYKRLSSNQEALSLFADAFDEAIDRYQQESDLARDEVLTFLQELQALLVQSKEKQGRKEIFKEICSYLAFDLEGFLYDFILDEIDRKEELGAKEWIELFEPYLLNPYWFEILKMRLTRRTTEQFEALYLLAKQMQDFDFIVEVVDFFIEEEEFELAATLLLSAMDNLNIEAEFVELLCLSEGLFSEMNKEKERLEVKKILDNRFKIPDEKFVSKNDSELLKIKKLIEDL